MKKTILFSFAALTTVTMAISGEIVVFSELLYAPNEDGTLRDTSVGSAATVFACVTDAATYATYASDSYGLYDAYLNGAFDNAEFQASGQTFLGSWTWPEDNRAMAEIGNNYVVMIATFFSEEFDRTYFIAKALSGEYTESMQDEFEDLNVYLNPTSWSYIAPPTPLEISCTSFAVSNGTVTAIYLVSDITGFSVGNSVNFTVAYSLARNAAGELSTTTLAGTVVSVDSAASTFTATLTPASGADSFFILGIEE